MVSRSRSADMLVKRATGGNLFRRPVRRRHQAALVKQGGQVIDPGAADERRLDGGEIPVSGVASQHLAEGNDMLPRRRLADHNGLFLRIGVSPSRAAPPADMASTAPPAVTPRFVAGGSIQETRHRRLDRSCQLVGPPRLGLSIPDVEVDGRLRIPKDLRSLLGRIAIAGPAQDRQLPLRQVHVALRQSPGHQALGHAQVRSLG